jgi:hypothetical protein
VRFARPHVRSVRAEQGDPVDIAVDAAQTATLRIEEASARCRSPPPWQNVAGTGSVAFVRRRSPLPWLSSPRCRHVACGVETAALVPGEGALATGLGATGAVPLEEAGVTIVVTVPFTSFFRLFDDVALER